jgi:hypothetical protein
MSNQMSLGLILGPCILADVSKNMVERATATQITRQVRNDKQAEESEPSDEDGVVEAIQQECGHCAQYQQDIRLDQ